MICWQSSSETWQQQIGASMKEIRRMARRTPSSRPSPTTVDSMWAQYAMQIRFNQILRKDGACKQFFQDFKQGLHPGYQQIDQLVMREQNISGWLLDLSQPIYFIHPNYKFWEIRLEGVKVTFRVGKIKDGEETNIEEVDKDYASNALAKTTVIRKIEDKLTKGYEPRGGKKAAEKIEEEQGGKKMPLKNGDIKDKQSAFSGELYEKGKSSVKLEINGCRVRVTKAANGKQGSEIKSFHDYDQAVEFCLQEENQLISQGYKPEPSKFIYSFVEDEQQSLQDRSKGTGRGARTKKKQEPRQDKQFLSITHMTDEVMSQRSRNVSSAKSDRSYAGEVSDNSYIPSKLGAPSSACIKVLLAETWNNDVDPTGWIMSEKLDGVRCFWTGTTMFSRNGNRFFFPKFFTRGWPKSQLDGQLFIDRGKFSQTLSAVRKGSPIDSEWDKVRYLVFDCPGHKAPFKKRLELMEQVLSEIDNPYIKCHAHRECKGYQDLFAELDTVNKAEGQGLMLRDPQSKYENRRSKTLLKVKTFHDDEATVIGYKAGTGRCHGIVGALKVRNTHGVEFEVGSGMTDQIRRRPPKIGSTITYKYQQFNKDSGKPRFPTYMRKYDKI